MSMLQERENQTTDRESKPQTQERMGVARGRRSRTLLHNDTGGIIFSFLTWRELYQCVRVDKAWLKVVSTMPSVGLKIPSLPLDQFFASSLARTLSRHVRDLTVVHQQQDPSSRGAEEISMPPSLEMNHASFPHLRRLKLELQMGEEWKERKIFFPPSLTELDFRLRISHPSSLQTFFSSLLLLPHLTHLYLELEDRTLLTAIPDEKTRMVDIDWQPLSTIVAQLQTVTELTIDTKGMLKFRLFNESLAESIRKMKQLKKITVGHMDLLDRIFAFGWYAPPFPQLESFSLLRNAWMRSNDVDRMRCIQQLSTLTTLQVTMRSEARLRFSQYWPHLKELHLSMLYDEKNVEQTIEYVSECTELTSLYLYDAPLTSNHLASLFPHLPSLSTLGLQNADSLTTLSCFSHPSARSLWSSLTSLTVSSDPLWGAPFPLSEIVHLHPLRRLEILRLREGCFREKMRGEEWERRYKPVVDSRSISSSPSDTHERVFPYLRECEIDVDEEDLARYLREKNRARRASNRGCKIS